MAQMTSVTEALPVIQNGYSSTLVVFEVDGKEYKGTYHENGWFYSSDWNAGKRGKKYRAVMAQGPKAQCRMQSWGELPKIKASSWRYWE